MYYESPRDAFDSLFSEMLSKDLRHSQFNAQRIKQP